MVISESEPLMRIEISTVPDIMLYHDIPLVRVHLYTVGSVSASMFAQEMYFKKLWVPNCVDPQPSWSRFPKVFCFVADMQRSEFLSF